MHADKRHEIKYCFLLVAILAILYALCQNGQWVPGGGDDAFYLTIARDMASGKAGLFRDVPSTLAPLGWPYVQSLLMRISPTFLLLNAALVVFCLAAICLWYWILLRFASPLRACLAMLVVGILFEWHRFAYLHYAEALFYMLLAAAILLALQINEERPAWWRIPLLVALCPLALMVRWAGLALVSMPAAALLHGQLRPRWNRRWITFAVLFAVTVPTYFAARRTMHENVRQVNERTVSAVQRSETRLEMRRDEAIVKGVSEPLRAPFDAGPFKRLLSRVGSAGTWVTRLLWPPASVLSRGPSAAAATNVFGWILVALFALRLPAAIGKRQWLLGAAFLLSGLFVVIWGRPVPRYLAPMAPLIVLGIWDGLDRLLAADRSPRRQRIAGAVAGTLLGSIVAANGAILAVTVFVAQAPDYVTRCQAGEHAELIGVAKALGERDLEQGDLAVAAQYEDPNRSDRSNFGPRMVRMLTGEEVLTPPRTLSNREEVLAWARAAKVRYLLTRPAGEMVTRAWHFRLGDSAGRPYYELLELTDDGGSRTVKLPQVVDGVRRVPGL